MIRIDENSYKVNKPRNLLYSNNKRDLINSKNIAMPSFTGKASIAAEGIEEVVKSFMPLPIRVLNFLGGKRGEIQNILLNAAGTGLVAPVFIKYNFLSDADDDTRTYSAWRQPLSAGLAILTQVGFTIPFYKKYDYWANNGNFDEKMNKTLFQDESYIRKMLKKEDRYKNATKDILDAAVQREKKRQMDELRNSFHSDSPGKGRPIYKYADGTSQRMSDATYKNLLDETLNRLSRIDEIALKELEETVKRRTQRSKYYKDNYAEAHDILENLRVNIANSTSRKNLTKYINKEISELKSKPQHAEMILILKDLKSRAKYAENGKMTFSWADIKLALDEKVENMIAHANKYKNVKSDKEIELMVKATVEKDKLALTELVKFYKGLRNKITETTSVDEITQQLNQIKKKLNLKGCSLDKNFVNELANRLVASTKAHQSWYKQFTGIFVTLAILPFTCTLLNWIYPRFMDIFFPNLSNKKHDNASAKLVALAPKAALAEAQRPIGEVLKEKFATINNTFMKPQQVNNNKKVEVA